MLALKGHVEMWLVRRAAEGWFVRFFWQCRRSGRRKVWPRQRRSKRLAKFLFNSDWWLINTDLLHCQSLYSPLMCICSVRPLTSLVQPVFSCFGLGWKVSLLYLRLLFKLWYKTMFFVSAPTPCKLESTATTCCGSTRAGCSNSLTTVIRRGPAQDAPPSHGWPLWSLAWVEGWGPNQVLTSQVSLLLGQGFSSQILTKNAADKEFLSLNLTRFIACVEGYSLVFAHWQQYNIIAKNNK